MATPWFKLTEYKYPLNLNSADTGKGTEIRYSG